MNQSLANAVSAAQETASLQNGEAVYQNFWAALGIMALRFFIIIFCFLILGLLIEKVCHREYDIGRAAYQLRMDVKSAARCFFRKDQIRHIFTKELADSLISIVRPYAHPAFDMECFPAITDDVPFINIAFVPAHIIKAETLSELSQLLLLKFRRYLLVNNLRWKSFVCYTSGQGYVNIYLYYSEFDRDLKPFTDRYRAYVLENADIDFGLLHDEQLDSELDFSFDDFDRKGKTG